MKTETLPHINNNPGVTTMSQRPDLYSHTINTLQHGATAIELSEQLHECVQAAQKTGKKATLTVTLTIKPVGRDTGQYEFREDIKCKIPSLDRGMTLMFGTPDGNLTRNDPRQGELQLRSADEKKPITEALKTA